MPADAMTPEARAALATDLRIFASLLPPHTKLCDQAADLIESDGKRIAELEAMVAALQPEERCESCQKVLGRGWKYDSSGDVKLCPRCYAELCRQGVR